MPGLQVGGTRANNCPYFIFTHFWDLRVNFGSKLFVCSIYSTAYFIYSKMISLENQWIHEWLHWWFSFIKLFEFYLLLRTRLLICGNAYPRFLSTPSKIETMIGIKTNDRWCLLPVGTTNYVIEYCRYSDTNAVRRSYLWYQSYLTGKRCVQVITCNNHK